MLGTVSKSSELTGLIDVVLLMVYGGLRNGKKCPDGRVDWFDSVYFRCETRHVIYQWSQS